MYRSSLSSPSRSFAVITTSAWRLNPSSSATKAFGGLRPYRSAPSSPPPSSPSSSWRWPRTTPKVPRAVATRQQPARVSAPSRASRYQRRISSKSTREVKVNSAGSRARYGAQRERERQHPLPHRDLRKNAVREVRRRIAHSPSAALKRPDRLPRLRGIGVPLSSALRSGISLREMFALNSLRAARGRRRPPPRSLRDRPLAPAPPAAERCTSTW